MSSDHSYYVYEHWRPDTGACFYVGKGKRRRAWAMAYGRNARHRSIATELTAKGFAVDVRIIARDLDHGSACAMERALISSYGRSKLCNITAGGEGSVGLRHSEETKKRIGDKNRGRKKSQAERDAISAFMKTMPRTAKHRAAISAAMRGNKNISPKAVSASNIRRKGEKRPPRTAETIAKMSAALKGRRAPNKGVKASAEARMKMSVAAKVRCARQRAAV